jgi:type II secretory pathway pseudopilin PulG
MEPQVHQDPAPIPVRTPISSSREEDILAWILSSIVILILAAIALPIHFGAQQKAKLAAVKGNAHTLQLCAESYATDSGGSYALTPQELYPYYPTGGNSIGGKPGILPSNPITGKKEEEIIALPPATVDALLAGDKSALDGVAASPGALGYGVTRNRQQYVVVPFGKDGVRLAGPNNGTLILSNY